MLFKDFLDRRVKGGEKGLPLFFHDKEKTYRFCKENNIRTVEKINMFNNIQELLEWFENCPDEFVIKPSFLSSMVGVMVLTKQEDGKYYEGLSKRVLEKKEIIDIQINFFNKSQRTEKHIVIEEKINDKYIDGIPLDYKVYIFYNQIAFIGVYNRNNKKLFGDWFDCDFKLLEEGLIVNQEPHTFHSEHPQSIKDKDKKAIIDFAKMISKKVKLPFVRLDLYLSETGPVLGEVTLSPGGLYYQKMYKVSNQLQLMMDGLLEQAFIDIAHDS
ncbi:ATP-grasp fold amidoligase family protein [Acinetobacter rudis]|uniref:ATP-grasp fold amidoligase family protein n=1 Tax=Acinetobacter rudis TaxID=632955 RepID=UPI00333FB651